MIQVKTNTNFYTWIKSTNNAKNFVLIKM